MKKITTIFAMLTMVTFMAACGPSIPSLTNTPNPLSTMDTALGTETPSSMETGTAGVSASTEGVDQLIAMVNDYVTSGEITGNAENGLLAKLETINQKVMDGQNDPAANEMGAFVNEVQAQQGKKISDAAATALIAKAEEITVVLQAIVPVTGDTETVATTTSQPNVSISDMSQTAPMGDKLKHEDKWDETALMVSQSIGMSTFDYDLYQLPTHTSWKDTLAYYTTEAAAAGWGAAPSQTDKMSGGNYAVWSVLGSDGMKNYFVVAQVDAPDGSYTLNLNGK